MNKKKVINELSDLVKDSFKKIKDFRSNKKNLFDSWYDPLFISVLSNSLFITSYGFLLDNIHKNYNGFKDGFFSGLTYTFMPFLMGGLNYFLLKKINPKINSYFKKRYYNKNKATALSFGKSAAMLLLSYTLLTSNFMNKSLDIFKKDYKRVFSSKEQSFKKDFSNSMNPDFKILVLPGLKEISKDIKRKSIDVSDWDSLFLYAKKNRGFIKKNLNSLEDYIKVNWNSEYKTINVLNNNFIKIAKSINSKIKDPELTKHLIYNMLLFKKYNNSRNNNFSKRQLFLYLNYYTFNNYKPTHNPDIFYKEQKDWFKETKKIILNSVYFKNNNKRTARSLFKKISYSSILSYQLTELVGTSNNSKKLLDDTIKSLGSDFVYKFPAIHDKLLSVGPFQLTSKVIGVSDKKTFLDSLADKIFGKDKLPKSVLKLSPKNQLEYALLFALYNIDHISNIKNINNYVSSDDVALFISTAHHLPLVSYKAFKEYVRFKRTKNKKIDFFNYLYNRRFFLSPVYKYAKKTLKNLYNLEGKKFSMVGKEVLKKDSKYYFNFSKKKNTYIYSASVKDIRTAYNFSVLIQNDLKKRKIANLSKNYIMNHLLYNSRIIKKDDFNKLKDSNKLKFIYVKK